MKEILSKNYQVLVVEDDTDLLAFIADALREAGLAVLTATSSAEACAILKNETTSLVLLDWFLGRSDTSKDSTGAPVLRRSREIDPLMPVIVMSGKTHVDVRTDAVMKQADSFIAKPFSMSLLVSHVSQLLKKQRASRQLFNVNKEEDILPLHEVKIRYIRKVLAVCNGNVSLAANKLRVHRHTVMAAIGKDSGSNSPIAEHIL